MRQMAKPKTEYQKLKAVWDKKLKDSGFVDIEHADGSINSGVPRSLAWKDDHLRQIVQDYYTMAYHFLNSHPFECELDKVIWQYHTDGLSVRKIVKVLAEVLPKEKTNKIRVWKTVKSLQTLMKAKYLQP